MRDRQIPSNPARVSSDLIEELLVYTRGEKDPVCRSRYVTSRQEKTGNRYFKGKSERI